MSEVKDKQYRAKLIKIIIKTCLSNYLLETSDGIKGILEKELNDSLNFNVKVDKLNKDGGRISGTVLYETNTGEFKAIDFSVIGKETIF